MPMGDVVEARHSTARVLISGGGIAALETALALDRLARGRVAVELISPRRDFVFRPRPGWTPLGAGPAARFDLDAVATEMGARYRSDALAAVRVAEQEAVTKRGAVLPYDALVVAHGATAERSIRGAITFWTRDDEPALRQVLSALEQGELARIALAVPGDMPWSLPLYELALKLADQVNAPASGDERIVIATPERRPLELFGDDAVRAVETALREHGIQIRTGAAPLAFVDGGLTLDSGEVIEAGQVIALPRMIGREIAGLPTDELGFLPTDADGRVRGLDAVYAAGDATAFPVKQGVFAGPQADAAAEHLAARLGAALQPTPFHPVLRGTLARGDSALESLWWPSTSFAGRHLTAHLAAQSRAAVQAPAPQVDGLALEVELTAA
jgi:sulfide:quinone oxidoreductase